MRVCFRGFILFVIGVLFYYIFGLIQGFRSGIFNDKFSQCLLSTSFGIPLCCGLLSVACGLTSPRLYHNLKIPNAYEPEWSSIMRCVIFFMGISHASAKLDIISISQLLLTSFCFAIGIWWIFDRSVSGILTGFLMSLLGTGICLVLGDQTIRSIDPLLTSWLPCIFFSGGITTSLVGRQLAKLDGFDSFKLKAE
ncbi:Insulin-induced -like protein [Echinococcus granulosus]|uniref:Insulin induced gene 2 protein n=1 Tax=Echinococcus granulosus TaxID=6210 RepID=A0A068W7G0_ECHGR|nr:Insulin-induced -like protein [Echinococcus granulosus]CDS15627.1 insulin induced gene 2 protein [Echinococcus granulosus]